MNDYNDYRREEELARKLDEDRTRQEYSDMVADVPNYLKQREWVSTGFLTGYWKGI